MINKKIANPLKISTIGLFVYYAFRLHNSKVDAYAKATELLSQFHENVMSSIISDIDNIKAGLSYDDLVVDILTGLDSFKKDCLLYTSPSPRDATLSRMPSSA